MKTRNGLWFVLFVVLLTAALGAIMQPFPSEESAAATWSRGALHVTLPYHAPRAGSGQLTVEVLSPEDEILGSAQMAADAVEGSGAWQQAVRLTKNMGIDDLVWQRVRFRFTYSGERDAAIQGTESVSQILRRPVVHVLGQRSYAEGGEAAVRVIATDTANNPLEGSVRVELAGHGTLFTGKLNHRGTAEAQFRFAAGLTGSFNLRYVVETAVGSADVTQPVKIEDKVRILLTTEKPIYQPGQTIHIRALALDRLSHQAGAGRDLTFEIEDSRGNKVFKKAAQTDKFGIASAEFTLAEEVNLGTYHLRAGGSEVALNVERYVLPKFKVAVEFAGEAQHGYRPGQHVTGTVRANYFFGKPVDDCEITVKATGMDVAEFAAGSVAGKTDRDGAYHFDLALPNYFAGRPLSRGAARVLIEATVKDAAGHSETRGEPITVSESPLIVTAVPEGGTLIPNLENQVFILTSYADGKPAVADVTVQAEVNPPQTATTDPGGVAVVRFKATAGTDPVKIDAKDREGNHVSSTVNLAARGGADQILLRTERAVYRAGDRIDLKVFSTKARGTAYVDIVKEGQTVLTRDVDIENGRAELALTATPDLAGTIDCNAYLFTGEATSVGDHRLIFVQPSDELQIETTADAQSYKPGGDATIRFRVTNAHGQGVQAALGVQVVDEAVFALAEKQPGFAKVFFYLEQEAMKPRYEIHSIGAGDIVEPVTDAQTPRRDRAARALFAATEIVNPNKFETEVGRATPMAKYAEYYNRYRERFVSQAIDRMTHARGDAANAEFQDPWGTDVKVEHPQWYSRTVYLIRSAGPDKRFGTPDDLQAYLEERTQKELGRPTSGTIDVQIEHDRGAFNGMAQITGRVIDQTGAAIPNATVSAREAATDNIRSARTNRDGSFTLAGLARGAYDVRVSSAGFQTNSRQIALVARDRAVVTTTLQVGSVTEAVFVMAPAPMPQAAVRMFAAQRAMGVVGGVVADGNAMFERQSKAMSMVDVSAAATTLASLRTGTIPSSPVPHVRSYFPEAMYINPEVITDGVGNASISIPLADSITTWRMALTASTTRGALGSGTSSLKVFQDFFVDLDLPVTLTQGDRISIPVAVYNYASGRGDVSLHLQPDDWFTLVSDTPDKTLSVDAGRVGGSQFTIEAKHIGKFQLTLAANMAGGARRADIVVRQIEVVPNGREQTEVFNGRLESAVEHRVTFPATAIDGASKILVRLYPGPLSQVIEGMDSLLRMPFGCFEQTSSATYPNVLALDYMKRTKKLTPEVHAKAEGFIAQGYQRLLTFEVAGGGFSWFGSAPANKILTSYGLMEFSDMSKVHDIDPKVISRTQEWLANQQQADGSWKPDTQFINEGATNRFNSDVTRITAYIAWSLENTGYQGPAIEKARPFLANHMDGKLDAYTLAVLANFAVDYGKDRAFTRQAMQQLLDARTEKDDQTWWTAEETAVFARGQSASVETTGLAVQALLKWGEDSNTAGKALRYLAAKKSSNGDWGTTQATIMALRAVLLSTEKGAADVRGTLEVALNGKTVENLALTPDNNDLLHQFVFSGADAKNGGTVALKFNGKGGLAYQVVGRYFLPWDQKAAGEPLSIKVDYDRTRMAQNDIATATATVKNNLPRSANMVMIDLGIPPGFDLLSEDLQDYQEKSGRFKSGRLEKFNLTATQAILYFDSISAGDSVTLQYRLRAKYPLRAFTVESRVYEYYVPEVKSVAKPVEFEVHK
ncbi:MAG TPA: MG2 domain-containing protein [Bryobacteraceae bacterium]|nr:MG2 domain-containing protein [Bryobacteraceae bacterium]